MKRLYFLILVFGAFFCFDFVHAGTYQNMTSLVATSTQVNYPYSGRVRDGIWRQSFTADETGTLLQLQNQTTAYTSSVSGTGKFYFSQMSSSSCNALNINTLSYTNFNYNNLTDLLIPVSSTVVKGLDYCLIVNLNTTYDIYLWGNDTYANNNAYIYYIDGSWYYYSARQKKWYDPLPETYFSITYPEQNQQFLFGSIESLNFHCYMSSSKYAIYYDDAYLTAQASDFQTCNESDFSDGDRYVQTLFTVKDGMRKMVILDENYLTDPTATYKRELNYYGKLVSDSYDLYGKLLYPTLKDPFGRYSVTSTELTVAKMAILKKDQSSQFSPIVGATYTVYYRNYDTGTSSWIKDQEVISYIETSTPNPVFQYDWNIGSYVMLFNVSSTYDNKIEWMITHQSEETSKEYSLLKFVTIPGIDGENYFNPPDAIPPILSTSSPNESPGICECSAYEDSLVGNVSKAICSAGCDLFYPKKFLSGQEYRVENFKNTLETYPPFGYFFVYRDAVSDMASSTGTSTSPWIAFENWNLWMIIREIMGYFIYVLGGLAIFKLFRKLI